jgi:undecaprenyl-diphosphatase
MHCTVNSSGAVQRRNEYTCAMLEQLILFDKQIFLFLNGLGAPWLDHLMFFISRTFVWVPLYLLLAYWIYKWQGKQLWLVVLCAVLCVVLTDQITSSFMKPYFERLRPSHDPQIVALVHVVNEHRGYYHGFASSHAANTFGLASLLFFLFWRRQPWIKWLFVWAAVVSYSRIYLGLHYPGDIMVGALLGVGCGYLCAKLYDYLLPKFPQLHYE